MHIYFKTDNFDFTKLFRNEILSNNKIFASMLNKSVTVPIIC